MQPRTENKTEIYNVFDRIELKFVLKEINDSL